jgi:hypothetical protein
MIGSLQLIQVSYLFSIESSVIYLTVFKSIFQYIYQYLILNYIYINIDITFINKLIKEFIFIII